MLPLPWQRACHAFELFSAWERCVLVAEPSLGPLGSPSYLLHAPCGDGAWGGVGCGEVWGVGVAVWVCVRVHARACG